MVTIAFHIQIKPYMEGTTINYLRMQICLFIRLFTHSWSFEFIPVSFVSLGKSGVQEKDSSEGEMEQETERVKAGLIIIS